MANTLLAFKEVTVTYTPHPKQHVTALKKLSLTMQAGEVLGLIGANGAGKTTTIKAALGFASIDSGVIEYEGVRLDENIIHAHIRYLPEKFVPQPHLTGREFLSMVAQMDRVEHIADRVTWVLKKVGLENAGDRRLSGYSKGMTQRIGLAQTLLGNPQCIILDEPTTGLDPIGRNDVKKLMQELKADGISILLCTHVLAEVEAVCDRVAVLVQGRLRYLGDIPGFLKTPSKHQP